MQTTAQKLEVLMQAINEAQGSHDILPHKTGIVSILAEAHAALLKADDDIKRLVEREGDRLCSI